MSTARRDLLHEIELEVQKKWEESKIFETDAGSTEGTSDEKFMCTFPYPYMNGALHIGHGYSLTKAMFAAHFHRLLGKKVLFPFGFHCTGMPIQAAANKLKKELAAYGSPIPTFPAGRPAPEENAKGEIVITDDGVSLVWKQPAATGSLTVKAYKVLMKAGDAEFREVKVVPPPENGKAKATVPIEDGGCVYKILTELSDGSYAPESKESDAVEVGAAPKDTKKPAAGQAGAPVKRVAKKVAAKSGDAAFQFEILLAMGLKKEDLHTFVDPLHWLKFFPPMGMRDLKRFGVPVDFRRSFITTSVNPYYDSFIRWQFGHLKKKEKIGFGKRPTIYSEVDQQACMDHDRAEGEGVAPQEYTAIKIGLLEMPTSMEAVKGKKVFLLAATLRAETMPGQTNCWILPEGTYGCFKAPKEGEVYVCSERAARNMSFQDILLPWGKPELLCKVQGKDLIGCKVEMPTSKYPVAHLLPLLTIKMDKGTGIVTSVPSDSPDDYAAFMDLMKPAKREFHGVKAEWVEPFELVPIISVEIDGEVQTVAAKYMCEKLGVQSQKDKEKLLEAHDVCYKLGFDKGTMIAGPFKGMAVKKAKFEFRKQMVDADQAFIYSEPEKQVIGRSGDECVVAGIDQWYLKYGQEEWRKQIEDHVRSDNFCAYNDRIKESFAEAINWLKEWACSRSFGLGTRVPWDEQFVIESLSDSTIYMAYYTVAHFLQGNLDGTEGTSEKIEPADLTQDVWDYVFLDGTLPADSKIPKGTLEKMRKEFRFWYPMDLRVSGKDLIQNHLTMALYNHACVWEKEPEMWPRSIFCNGWLLVNNEKMSKSKGNFFTLTDIVNKYTADTVRLAMASAGDTLEPANFDETVANKALLFMPPFLENLKAVASGSEKLDESEDCGRFVDRWFANTMNRLVEETKEFYAKMYYREACRTAFYEFSGSFDQYRDICKSGKILPNKALTLRYLEWQMIILSPITPHFCEHGWGLLGKAGSVLDARWPTPTAAVDPALVAQGRYMYEKVPHDFIKLQEKAEKSSKPPGKAVSSTVYVAKEYPEWKLSVLAKMRARLSLGELPLISQEELQKDDLAKAQWKAVMQELMQDASLKPVSKHVGPFAAFKRDEAVQFGASALEASVPFDELALLKENVEYLKDKLKVDMTVILVEDCTDAAHKDAAATAQPGAPAIKYTVEAGGSGYPKGA